MFCVLQTQDNFDQNNILFCVQSAIIIILLLLIIANFDKNSCSMYCLVH